jgi:hypothetical protein
MLKNMQPDVLCVILCRRTVGAYIQEAGAKIERGKITRVLEETPETNELLLSAILPCVVAETKHDFNSPLFVILSVSHDFIAIRHFRYKGTFQ